MRKHYLTICTRGDADIVITHIKRDQDIEVTCEQSAKGGFNTLVMNLDGKILSSTGYTPSDQQFLVGFVMKNKPGIIEESEGVIL